MEIDKFEFIIIIGLVASVFLLCGMFIETNANQNIINVQYDIIVSQKDTIKVQNVIMSTQKEIIIENNKIVREYREYRISHPNILYAENSTFERLGSFDIFPFNNLTHNDIKSFNAYNNENVEWVVISEISST